MIPDPPFDAQETLSIVSADNRRLRAEIEHLRGLLRKIIPALIQPPDAHHWIPTLAEIATALGDKHE